MGRAQCRFICFPISVLWQLQVATRADLHDSPGGIRCTGTWHYLRKGGRVPYSLVNNTMPHFEAGPGYCASAFPCRREDGSGPPLRDLRDDHFLSLCMKLVYEDPVIIQVPSLLPLLLKTHNISARPANCEA